MLPALARSFRRAALPMACYFGVTLALPLVNGAARSGAAFVQHALIVLVVPPMLIVLWCAITPLARRLVRTDDDAQFRFASARRRARAEREQGIPRLMRGSVASLDNDAP